MTIWGKIEVRGWNCRGNSGSAGSGGKGNFRLLARIATLAFLRYLKVESATMFNAPIAPPKPVEGQIRELNGMRQLDFAARMGADFKMIEFRFAGLGGGPAQ